MPDDKIKFNDVEYTEAGLASQSTEDLLKLRNLVAENMGVSRVSSFRDQPTAASSTWKALVKWNEKMTAEGSQAAGDGKKTSAPKEPKEPRVVKGALAQKVSKPTRSMFRKIEKVKKPDRVTARWDNYKDGMTILEVIEGDGMTPNDVTWYAQNGYMKLHEPTDEEFRAGAAAWYKREGKENPEDAKAKAAEKKKADAEAKKKADADAAAAKKAADAKKTADAKK